MSWVTEIYEIAKENNIGEKIVNAFNVIAEKIGVASEFVWKALIKQQYVESITNVIVYGVLLAVILALILASVWLYKIDSGSNTAAQLPIVLSVLVVVIFTIFFCSTITETVTGFVNPEYGALQEIGDAIRSGNVRRN